MTEKNQSFKIKLNLNSLIIHCRKCNSSIQWGEKTCKQCGNRIISGCFIWFPLSLVFIPFFLIVILIRKIYLIGPQFFLLVFLPIALIQFLLESFMLLIITTIYSPYPRRARVKCNNSGLPPKHVLAICLKEWKPDLLENFGKNESRSLEISEEGNLFLFLKKIFTKKENQILYAEGEIVNLLLEENKRSKKKPTGKTEEKDVDKLISLLLNAKDVETRKGLISEIGNLGNAKAIDPLINMLKDSDEFVRVYAAKALGRIGLRGQVLLLDITVTLFSRCNQKKEGYTLEKNDK